MILRQTLGRHGRTLAVSSTRQCRHSRYATRTYATTIDLDDPMHRQSEQDHKPKRSTPSHPDEPSSLLDAIGHTPTPATSALEAAVESAAIATKNLGGDVRSMTAAQQGGFIPPQHASFYAKKKAMPESPYSSLQEMIDTLEHQKTLASKGSSLTDTYDTQSLLKSPPTADEVSLEMLLANQCHLGQATALWHPSNSSYIFGIRQGIHIISLDITLSYLRRAAKVVHEVARRGGIILFVGTRRSQREIVVTSAKRAGSYHLFHRWIPGSLTNGQQILEKCAVKVVNGQDEELTQYRELLQSSARSVLRPDLVVCLNPQENETCLHECGLYNVPTIGIVDTDTNPTWVTYPIPANDDSLRSVGLISGVLSRAGEQGQRLRLELAQQGRLSYSTKNVENFLKKTQDLSGLDVQEAGGSRDSKDAD